MNIMYILQLVSMLHCIVQSITQSHSGVLINKIIIVNQNLLLIIEESFSE